MSLKINDSTSIQFQIDNLGRKTAKLIDKDAALFTNNTILCKFSAKMQERRGHCAVYYNSHPKFIITFFIRWLNNFADF